MEDPTRVLLRDDVPLERNGARSHFLLWKGTWRRIIRLGPSLNLNTSELKSWRGKVPSFVKIQKQLEKRRKRRNMLQLLTRRRETRLQQTAGGPSRWRLCTAAGRFSKFLLTTKQLAISKAMVLPFQVVSFPGSFKF